MKTPRFSQRWKRLVQEARRDSPAPVNIASLLAAVHAASSQPPAGWIADFSDLFASGRIIPTCLCGAAGLALVASWQIWASLSALAWAQWLIVAPGGAL